LARSRPMDVRGP